MIDVYTLHVCCMHPQESTPLQVMAAAFSLALFLPVPETVWDAAWIPITPDAAARKESALWMWGLERTFIYIPDEPPLPAIGIVYPFWWVGLVAWMLSDAAACNGGCIQLGAWNAVSIA